MKTEITRQAEREAFALVPMTCPNVQVILGILADRYKISQEDAEFTFLLIVRVGTGRLRNALVEALERAIRAEQQLARLEKKIKRTKKPRRGK